jgi:intracellular multiplication protein IcmP
MAKGEGARPGSDETKYLAAGILILAGGWLLWTFGRGVLAIMAFGLDWAQMEIIAAVGALSPNGIEWRNMQRDIVLSVVGIITPSSADFIDPYTLEWEKHFVRSSEVVAQWARWPITALMLSLSVMMLFRMRGERFQRQFSLTGRSLSTVYRTVHWQGLSRFWKGCAEGSRYGPRRALLWLLMLCRVVTAKKEWTRDAPDFAGYQAQHWKVALVGAAFDPDKEDPAWRQQMTPPEWLREYKISLTAQSGLDTEASGRAFAEQLGATWNGVRHAPCQAQAICIMAALNRNWETSKLAQLANKLAFIHVQNQNPEAVKAATRTVLAPFLQNEALVRAIDKIAGQHHYMSTAVLRVYGWGGPFEEWGGGEGASFAPSQFLWLKPVDRNLWYALQQNGRRAFMIEGAGTVSHYFFERIGRRPSSTPKVEAAIEGLEKYLTYHHIVDLEAFFRERRD